MTQPATYVLFKGVVTGVNTGPPLEAPLISTVTGTPVTGVYTFGPATDVSTTADWAASGFSTIATAVGASYATATDASGDYGGTYYPNAAPNHAKYVFEANECYVESDDENNCGLFSNLLLASATQPTWSAEGLPVLSAAGAPQGEFGFYPQGADSEWQVSYRITWLQQTAATPIVVSLFSSAASVTVGDAFLLTWSSTGTE